MDTKLKSNNITGTKRALCLILSLAFVALSFFCAALASSGFAVEGTLESLAGKRTSVFNESGAFYSHIYKYLCLIEDSIAEIDAHEEVETVKQRKETIVESALERFLEEKATIIREELIWAYKHLDGDTATAESEKLKEIISNNEGRQFLKFAHMVRQEAFEEKDFHTAYNSTADEAFVGFTLPFTLDEEQARSQLDSQFDYALDYDATVNTEQLREALIKSQNIHCYFSYNGKTVTNMENAEKEIANIHNNELYLCFEGDKYTHNGFSTFEKRANAAKYILYGFMSLEGIAQSMPEGASVYIYIEPVPMVYRDNYGNLFEGYVFLSQVNIPVMIALAVMLFMFALVCLYGACCCSGRKIGEDGIKLCFIDKVPSDIHLIVSWALSLGFEALALLLVGIYGFACTNSIDLTYETWRYTFSYSPLTMFGAVICGMLAWLVFYEWVCSVARTVKSEKSYFKSSVIGLIIRGILKLLKLVFVEPFKLLWRAFTYQHGHFRRRFAIFWALAFSVYLLVIEIGIVNDAFRFTAFFAIVCNCAAAFFLLKYVQQLDEIITASAERREPDVDVAKLPKSLRVLANSMSVTTHELNRAVEAAVRDERMRTELITNVSHDLKTPLTSIISYVDLLKRCDITDETALSYIGVLEDKSARLKRLIEDLVEASKASSGAVKLNVVQLDFAELINQALGENSDSFRHAGIDVVFTPEQAETVIFADGQKTYRIIENLLDNACKYSAPHTRVYLRLFSQGDMSVFEIKNISRDPLNITPEELTQRFVRGDSSRTDGGNGLGLAIASDLCALHKGELKLFIDGDLFKAQVWLPMSDRHVE